MPNPPLTQENLKDIASLPFVTDANKRAFGAEVGTEPSSLSSSNGADLFKTKIKPVIDAANQAVTDSSMVQDKLNEQDKKDSQTQSDIPPDVQEEMDSLKDPVEEARKTQEESWERQMKDAENKAVALTAAATKAAKASISILTGSWKERKKLLQDSNRRNEASWTQQFLRFGQAEYSPGMTSDFLEQKENEGLEKVAAADEEYRAKVASINAALNSEKYGYAAELTKELQGIEEKMNNSIMEVAKETKAVNDKLKENIAKTTRENAIGEIITKYNITDPLELQEMLSNGDGVTKIEDVSLEEIEKVLKISGLDPKSQMAGLTADYKTFSHLKKTDPAYKDWTYTEYLAAVSAAKRAPKSTDSSGIDTEITNESGGLLSFDEFKFTPEAKKLINDELKRQTPEDGSGSFTTATAEAFLKDIYNEATVAYYRDNPDKSKKFTAANLPTPLRENLVADINNDFSLNDLVAAYPDVSSSYISATFNALKKKKETEDEEEISDEEFINALKGQ